MNILAKKNIRNHFDIFSNDAYLGTVSSSSDKRISYLAEHYFIEESAIVEAVKKEEDFL